MKAKVVRGDDVDEGRAQFDFMAVEGVARS
jgi:hypothetical protein